MMTGKVRRIPGENKDLENLDDDLDDVSIRKLESIDRMIENTKVTKKAIYQAALEERNNSQSAALPPISNKNRNIPKYKKGDQNEKDLMQGQNNIMRSQMNILS